MSVILLVTLAKGKKGISAGSHLGNAIHSLEVTQTKNQEVQSYYVLRLGVPINLTNNNRDAYVIVGTLAFPISKMRRQWRG